MNPHPSSKVTSEHRSRLAFLYVRQSTLQQVVQHSESTRRQYDLRERAAALGWQSEQIEVIDSDLGLSGASADREGFQKLVAEVGLGNAGLVMGLEVSRLARNSTDWHRLLELCALTQTLILDEDGLYDPSQFNDRLLLGLKGTMSEAELHMLRARLVGGMLNKARRGELRLRLPVGFVYDQDDNVVLDPDTEVQETLRLVFTTFRRVGSALGVVKAFREQGLRFPTYAQKGPRTKQPLLWRQLDFNAVLRLLHNPRYAGIYAYGRTRQRRLPDGKYHRQHKPAKDWLVLIADAHPGYISREHYEDNLRQLADNARASGADRRRSPPREGPALLQGLVLCGRCGRRMTVQYKQRASGLIPLYYCGRRSDPWCQSVHGGVVDDAVGERLVELVTPLTLEATVKVQQELEQRLANVDRLRLQQVERARYEAELARQRYLCVDPHNRLVATSLEADWNQKLETLDATRQDYERLQAEDRNQLSREKQNRLQSLVRDFSVFWADADTSSKDRKRVLRLLITDVTLLRDKNIQVHIRFRGGACETLTRDIPKRAWQLRKTPPELVQEIDQLLDHYDELESAEILNRQGRTTATNHRLTRAIVCMIRRTYRLRSRKERLLEQGYVSLTEAANETNVGTKKVLNWHRLGLIHRERYSGGWWLYENPTLVDKELPGLPKHPRPNSPTLKPTNEVQYES